MADLSFTDGEYIFREGESAKFAYIVKSGEVEITKITSVIPDTTVSLSIFSETEKDYRGTERNYGSVSPRDYFNGMGYAKEGDSIKKSVVQGYVGYPLVSLLGESLLNPAGYNNLSLSDTNVSLLSELNNNSGIPVGEQGIYNLNLARIDLGNY